MISEAPEAAASTPSQILEKIKAFVAASAAAAEDGITLSEFSELCVTLLRVMMHAVDSIPIEGAQKKAWVLEAVSLLFDSVADRAVPVVLFPIWILFRPAVRALVLSLASGAVESLLPLVRLQ